MPTKFKKLIAGLLATSCLISPIAVAQIDPAPTIDSAATTLVVRQKIHEREHAPRIDSSTALIAALKTNILPTPKTKVTTVPKHILRINPQAAQQCGPITGGAPNPVIENRIHDFTTALKKSQTGRDLFESAATYDNGKPAWMCFQKVGGLHAMYYTGQGVLAVGLHKSNNEIMGDAVHELRHLFQEKAGLFDIPSSRKIDRIHVEYAGEADAEATAALVLWELKEAGNPGPWNQHNDHKNYGPRSICYAHITTSFKKAVEGGVAPAMATQHAFRAWYRDQNLLSSYEQSVLEGLSRIQSHFKNPEPVSQCDRPAQSIQPELPSDSVAQAITERTGNLPSYNMNFVKQGGGLKAILQMP